MAAQRRAWWRRRSVAVLIVLGMAVGSTSAVTTLLWVIRTRPQSSVLPFLGFMGGGCLALICLAAAIVSIAISRARRRGSTADEALLSLLRVLLHFHPSDRWLINHLLRSLEPSGRATLRTTAMPPPRVVRSTAEQPRPVDLARGLGAPAARHRSGSPRLAVPDPGRAGVPGRVSAAQRHGVTTGVRWPPRRTGR